MSSLTACPVAHTAVCLGAMGSTRITVTLPSELVEQIRQSHGNVSGYVSEAVANHLRWDLIAKDLEEYQVEHGAFTEEEKRYAREEIEAALKRRRVAA